MARRAGAPAERKFFEHHGREGFHDLTRRTARLQRQVRDNGITYNVYFDSGWPAAPVVARPVR